PSGSWPVARWCHSCTPWRTSGRARPSRPRTSAPRGRMCSLVTRRVSPATAALTRLKATLRSLLTCRRSTGSVGTGSSSAHWPKTRRTLDSSSAQRTNICCSEKVKATSPSSSILGSRPSSSRAAWTRSRRGVSSSEPLPPPVVDSGLTFGRAVGSLMSPTYPLHTLWAMSTTGAAALPHHPAPGVHPVGGGVEVAVFAPDATAVRLCTLDDGDETPAELTRLAAAGGEDGW